MTATMGAASLRRSRRARGLVPLHRSAAARERDVAAFGGADDREPARRRASTSTLDDDALRRGVALLPAASRAALGRPVGVPLEYDVSVYKHQLPGGMTSTFRRQLGGARHGGSLARHPRRAAARARRARLADHGHAALAVRRRPGVSERHDRRALVAGCRTRSSATCSASTARLPAEIDPDVQARVLGLAAGRRRSRTKSTESVSRPPASASATPSATSCCCCG